MISLNLTTNNKEQERIKEYLENNVSENLADKINNGVKIVKDNKSLINKKDLNSFMKYACDEARKQAEKSASSVCVDDSIVFGWAIHYFEEDTIEGNLYSEDGTEYKVALEQQQKEKTSTKEVKQTPEKENKQQESLFDILNNTLPEPILEQPTGEVKEISQTIIEVDNQQIDTETGEILPTQSFFNRESMILLYDLLDGKLEVK